MISAQQYQAMSRKRYITHDSDARNDERTLRLREGSGAAGYGVYWMLLEMMRDAEDYMLAKDYKSIAYELRVGRSLVKSVVEDYDLFVTTDDKIYSRAFLRRMGTIDNVREQRAKAGRASAAARRIDSMSATQMAAELDVLMKDSIWVEAMCMRWHMKREELMNAIEEFGQSNICNGISDHKDGRDLRTHFNNWLRITKNGTEYKADRKKDRLQKRRATDADPVDKSQYQSAF